MIAESPHLQLDTPAAREERIDAAWAEYVMERIQDRADDAMRLYLAGGLPIIDTLKGWPERRVE